VELESFDLGRTSAHFKAEKISASSWQILKRIFPILSPLDFVFFNLLRAFCDSFFLNFWFHLFLLFIYKMQSSLSLSAWRPSLMKFKSEKKMPNVVRCIFCGFSLVGQLSLGFFEGSVNNNKLRNDSHSPAPTVLACFSTLSAASEFSASESHGCNSSCGISFFGSGILIHLKARSGELNSSGDICPLSRPYLEQWQIKGTNPSFHLFVLPFPIG
jgi:hypothetical protein